MERGQDKGVRAGDAAGQEQGFEGQWQRDQWGPHEMHSQTQALLLLLQ